MAQRDNILDGLAWASLSEPARVARISASLVRDLDRHSSEHTKTRIKEEVRQTSPPYGRGKAICEAVTREYKRQLPIYRGRQQAHEDWKSYQEHQAKRSTRVNNAYAAAFGRPPHCPTRRFPGGWKDWEARQEWDEKERERDKGDNCIGLTHQGPHVVCLVKEENNRRTPHVATIGPDGVIVRTYLRGGDEAKNLIEAAVSLGGPKVKAALAKGKKVVTDWVGRRSFVHHEGQDHVHSHVEELPWLAARYEEDGRHWMNAVPVIIRGQTVTDAPERETDWNDCH